MAMVFQWSGKNVRGIIQSGEMTANTKEEVISMLRRQNITPTIVTQKVKKKMAISFGAKIKDKDIVIFTRQFATMIDAGLPLVQALDILAKQTDNKALAKIIGDVKTDVEGGSTYADALKKYPKAFNELYVNMVAAGETGGILDTILARLGQYIEKAMNLKRKIKSAMVYPAIVTSVAAIVLTIIMVWVIPTFAKIFSSFGGVLPGPTRLVIAVSHFIAGKGGLVILIGLIALAVFLVQFRRSKKGRKITDAIFLKLPIAGILIRKVAVAKFTRTLGTLVSSGVPILDGLDITAKTAGNKVIEDAVYAVRQAVSEGKTLAEPLTKAKVFPSMVTQMIAVGESTGALDAMLSKIADFYDEEVDVAVANLTAMLEPMLMIFLGTAIGFIVVAMYLPIFKFGALVGK